MKNPAILFYTSDFITGTMFMNNEEVGAYIRCLCMQHQKGHLSKEEMLQICGDKLLEKILLKFKRDSKGFYYNKRMDEEIEKRENYSKSRANNRKSKKTYDEDMKNISKTYEKHMENENENENINENIKINSFKKPTLEEVETYCKERNNNVNAQKFIDFYESKGWMIGKSKMRDWKACVRTWEKDTPKKEEVPKWFNEKIERAPLTNKEQEEFNELLNSFS